MLFNSVPFVIFLPTIFIIYWILPDKYRWTLLLEASYIFYMCWNPEYVILIFFTTLISYLSAIIMEKQKTVKMKRRTLIFAATICLGVLFFFKYFNFISKSASDLLKIFTIKINPPALNLILPVGISFYTFQTLSYVIDVYKGDVRAEHHFGKYAVFISFFPQLVAGPIERTKNLLPQIKEKHEFNYDLAVYGLKQMTWGYFKKIIIADTIAQFTGKVYECPQNFQGFSLIIAILLFTIQIYCDFSGYSDIAIGTAKLLGIKLMTNFKSPYFSQSIKEFWSRWHISLSTWFRDYVYIPLGGSRSGKLKNNLNLIITFLISGLWHGADWTFVVWGGIHGLAQTAEKNIIKNKNGKSKGIIGILRVISVFCFCSFAWIFFASDSLNDALYILSHMLNGIASPITYLHSGFALLGLDRIRFIYLTLSILILILFDYASLKKDVIKLISSKGTIFRWCIYVFFTLWIILNWPTTNSTEFIYFQF